jgi:hypothetical protein
MADANDFLNAVGSSFDDFNLSVTDDGQLSADSTAEQTFPFDFCITFAGRPAFTLHLMAPSPAAAATTVEQMVRLANQTMPGWGSFLGACQPV